MKKYKVKEIYYTLQGEGMQSGRPAVFCRFTGCNLWSGREEDRSRAICDFCDTDFVGTDGENGGSYHCHELVEKVASLWLADTVPYVVCTGGEPLLQMDKILIEAFHDRGFEVGVETNGTYEPPPGLDWICVSPKPHSRVVLKKGDELKLIYPQPDLMPHMVSHWDFDYFLLQPMENDQWDANTQATIEYCLQNPQWRLSLQTHKYLGLR